MEACLLLNNCALGWSDRVFVEKAGNMIRSGSKKAIGIRLR